MTSVKRILIRGLTSVCIKDEECIVMLHHGKLADTKPLYTLETLSLNASSNQTQCQQSKAAHMMNMNQHRANQNHIPILKGQYVTLNPRLNHVKKAFDNKYILFVIIQY